MVPAFCRAVLAGVPPEIHGDGLQERDYLHVDDAVDAACDARFVLDTRPLEHWLRGLAVHCARREEHHRRVRAELPPGCLPVFDIESDPPERLCEFIGAPRSLARHCRVENPSLNRWGEALAACLPFAVKRALPDRLERPAKRWLGARRAPAGGSRPPIEDRV